MMLKYNFLSKIPVEDEGYIFTLSTIYSKDMQSAENKYLRKAELKYESFTLIYIKETKLPFFYRMSSVMFAIFLSLIVFFLILSGITLDT